jgi:hypothetical protein
MVGNGVHARQAQTWGSLIGIGWFRPVKSRASRVGWGACVIAVGLLGQAAMAQGRGQDHGPASGDCRLTGPGTFDVIVYGDEPAGIMTALALAEQLPSQRPGVSPRLALVREEPAGEPLGGTITRGGLAYLDRNQLPWDQWIWRGDHLAPSSRLYRQFLTLSGARQIAADPVRSDRAFRRALASHGVVLLSGAGLEGVTLGPRRICALQTRRFGTLAARYFIDSSLGADLAHRSGVVFRSGLGPGPLAQESLSLGWIFSLQGFNLEQFRALERRFTARLLDPSDWEAQGWLQAWPAYRRNRQALRQALLNPLLQPREAISWTDDSADQVSPALAIAFHGESGIPPGLKAAPMRLDLANIAVLGDRLSLNALLLRNDADQNRQVLAGGGRPLPWMEPYRAAITAFFRRHGATAVAWSPRLYVRSADQILDSIEPLSAPMMMAGGVPPEQAVGTFSYGLDIRGGLRHRVPLPGHPLTFNVGYRHTLPRQRDNLAVLGPAGGFAGLGVGAGRILELNVTVGQGLACAVAMAIGSDQPLGAIDPAVVSGALAWDYVPYGRPLDEAPPVAFERWWNHAISTLRWRLGGGVGSGLAGSSATRRCDGQPLSTQQVG